MSALKKTSRMPRILAISASDSSGATGLAADVRTAADCGVDVGLAITAVVAQGVRGVGVAKPVGAKMLRRQIDTVFADVRPDAVKVGLLPTAKSVHAVAKRLRRHHATHIVVEPVLPAPDKASPVSDGAIEAMVSELFALVELVVLGIAQAELLSGHAISGESDMVRAARVLHERWGCSVLVKGERADGSATDILCQGGTSTAFLGTRTDTPHAPGVGCSLSCAIAAHLARGRTLDEAIRAAKAHLSASLVARHGTSTEPATPASRNRPDEAARTRAARD